MFRSYSSWLAALALVVGGCGIRTNDGSDLGTGGSDQGTGGSLGGGSVGTGGGVSTGSGGSVGAGGSIATSADASDGAPAINCPAPPAGVKAAPCGYYVEGNKIKSAIDGSVHLFHGVARPSLEWSAYGEGFSYADADLMKTWKVNTVRFSMNQGFWVQGAANYLPAYKTVINNLVAMYESRGFDVILDLHWNSLPPAGKSNGQGNGPDSTSLTFWSQVAAAYKNDGHVLFELYNEPHDISDDQWFQGMTGLYNAVRGAGADNLVLIGGLDWAFDLTVMQRRPITGYNIVLVSHPYQDKQDFAGKVDALASTFPIILTEFGDRSGSCNTTTTTTTISHANQMGYSWTAWAWYPQMGTASCTFPSLITDWAGTTTAQGAVAKAALLQY